MHDTGIIHKGFMEREQEFYQSQYDREIPVNQKQIKTTKPVQLNLF